MNYVAFFLVLFGPLGCAAVWSVWSERRWQRHQEQECQERIKRKLGV